MVARSPFVTNMSTRVTNFSIFNGIGTDYAAAVHRTIAGVD